MEKWTRLTDLFAEDKEYERTIVSKIEKGILSVFMYIELAEYEFYDEEGPEFRGPIIGREMMEVYGHKAVAIIRGGGPCAFNFLVTEEPFDENFGERGYVWSAKPDLKEVHQLHIQQADADKLKSEYNAKESTITVRDDWRVIEFVGQKLFTLNDVQAPIIKYMVKNRRDVTSDELRKEIDRLEIDPIGTADKKFDFSNIFKPNSSARELVELTEKRGVYRLSKLWGNNPKIEEK